MNISSGYGYIAMPFYSVYAATKAAVGQFSDAMRRELYQYPLHVMTVYPAATDTDMMKTAVVHHLDSAQDVARAAIAGLLNQELKARVAARTQDVLVAQADAHTQQATALAATQRRAEERETFYQVFEQMPALVSLLRTPGHRFEFVNPVCQAFFPAGR